VVTTGSRVRRSVPRGVRLHLPAHPGRLDRLTIIQTRQN